MDAVRKAEHYVAAINAQTQVCKDTDEMISAFSNPGVRGATRLGGT